MPRASDGTAARDGVVHGVEAGRTGTWGAFGAICAICVIGALTAFRFGILIALRLGGQADHDVVQVREEFVGRPVDVGQGAYGGPQAAHRGGGVDAVADDLAHDEGDPGSGERDDVVPVTAHAVLCVGGQVAEGDIDGRLPWGPAREQAALQGEGGGAGVRVAAGVVDGDRRPRRDLLG